MREKIYRYLRRSVSNLIFIPFYYLYKYICHHPKIYSTNETIQTIIKNKASVSRFGDGEFKWMINFKQNSFQHNSDLMNRRLIEILNSSSKRHIVCIPEAFDFHSSDEYIPWVRKYWKKEIGLHWIKWSSLLNLKKRYYNTQITRPYIDYKIKETASQKFTSIKRIWENRNVIMVEGSKTRFGIGNDLLDNTKSVERIICPSQNAFDNYDHIISSITKYIFQINKKDILILISLGPTATILSYDLSRYGVQSIDIGHLDIEYEWFKRQVKEKVPINGKYVNEINNHYSGELSKSLINKYQGQIIMRVDA